MGTAVTFATELVTLPKELLTITSYGPVSIDFASLKFKLDVALPEISPPSVRFVPFFLH